MNPEDFSPKIKYIVIAVIISAIFYASMPGAGIFVGIVGIIIYFNIFHPEKLRDVMEPDGELEGYEHQVMIIAAYVIKADQKVAKSELEHVQRWLMKRYGRKATAKFMFRLTQEIEDQTDIDKAAKYISDQYSTATVVQLLHFLVGIATADDYLTNSELAALRKINGLFMFPDRTLESILAMFRFTRERPKQEKSEYKYKKSSSSSATLAYSILEIPANSTDDEVKKAYRRLAKMHHPDKVAHMGAQLQKQAKEKFQKILEAYEFIKEKRGMN